MDKLEKPQIFFGRIGLSDHFSLDEFFVTNTGLPFGYIRPSVLLNLQKLVAYVLEPLRNHLNEPIIINSGYRTTQINSQVGGVKNSHHLDGSACDFTCDHLADAYQFLFHHSDVCELIYHEKQKYIHLSVKL